MKISTLDAPQNPSNTQPKQQAADGERSAWERAVSAGTVEAFTAYVSQFPNGAHVGDARREITSLQKRAADDNAWSLAINTGTSDAFEQYVSQFPNGAHTSEARQRISLPADEERRRRDDETRRRQAQRCNPTQSGGRSRNGVFIPICPPGCGFSLEHRQCIPSQQLGGVIPCSEDDQSFINGRWVPNCR
jgi:hypothetical protein